MREPKSLGGRAQGEEAEWEALRDENDSLRTECQELRAEVKQLSDAIEEVVGMIPPSYDADDSPEGIVRTFIKDMNDLGQIMAKLTADYRLS
jgi:hypothetical protein